MASPSTSCRGCAHLGLQSRSAVLPVSRCNKCASRSPLTCMSLPPKQSESSWQSSRQPVVVPPPAQRGKNFRHELLVEMSVRGTRSAGSSWMKVVGSELERTLEYLLGPDAPLGQLLESARFQALSAWPPPSDQPLNIWVRTIASDVALSHLKGGSTATSPDSERARPGGIREAGRARAHDGPSDRRRVRHPRTRSQDGRPLARGVGRHGWRRPAHRGSRHSSRALRG